MLKQTIQYEDFDGNKVEDTLYFNISKTELADNLDLKDRLEEVQAKISSEGNRDLTTEEIKMVLDMVKTFIRLSYGERSADGKRFIKSDQVWTEFTQTAAYDAFLFSLFESPNKAFEFLMNIMPADVRAEAEKAAQAQTGAEALESREPKEKDPLSMSKEELLEAWQRKNASS